jgi:hypothetical protein
MRATISTLHRAIEVGVTRLGRSLLLPYLREQRCRLRPTYCSNEKKART